MRNPIVLNTNGVSRFADFVSQFPPILRQEPDVVEFLSLMSDYINNAYRDTQSLKTYSMQIITTDSRKEVTKKEFEGLRTIFKNASNSGVPILYVTDSEVDSLNPLYLSSTVKMKLVEDTDVISFVFSTDSSKTINVGDAVVGNGIPDDTIITAKTGNSLTLDKKVTSSGDEFITFTNGENDFDDVIQFEVGKVGDLQELRIKKDVATGVDYIKIFFEVDIRNIIGTIESIDSRYDFTGYSTTAVENLDNVLQAGDLKFRIENRNEVTVPNVQHNATLVGSTTPNNVLTIESIALSDIELGDKVISDYIPSGTYVTGISTTGVTLSNNISSSAVGNVTFYPTYAILPTDTTASILPSEGEGKFVRKFDLTSAAVTSAVSYDYVTSDIGDEPDRDENDYITISNYSALYDNASQKLTFQSKNLTALYFVGDKVNILLTRENGKKSIINATIETIAFGTDTEVTFEEPFGIDIDTTVDTVEFINKFGDFYSVDDVLAIGNDTYTIQRIVEYDIDGNIVDESDPDATLVTTTELQLDSDITTDGTFAMNEYHLVIKSIGNSSIDDYIEVDLDSVPSGITFIMRNADTGLPVINTFSSENASTLPYRYKYESGTEPWKWVDFGDGVLESELIHYLPYKSMDIELLNSGARLGDLLTVHTDIPRSVNVNVSSSSSTINKTSDTINVRRAIAADSIVVFNNTGNLPTPFVSGTEYYVVNPSGTTIQLSETKGGSAIDITSNGTGIQKLEIKYEYIYKNDDLVELMSLKSVSKRKSYKNVYRFDGDNWTVYEEGQTFRDGSGVFYSRDMTNVNVPEKYLDAASNPIFRDSETYITEENWKGKFLLGTRYYEGDTVGIQNGDSYRAIGDIESAALSPDVDPDNWSIIESSVFTESTKFGTNPYLYGPIDTQTISNTDVLKSNYSVRIDDTGKVLITNNDVRNVIKAGDTVNVVYTQLGSVVEREFLVSQTIFRANTMETEILVSDQNDTSETVIAIDASDNTVEVSSSEIWSFGQRISFSSTGTLPLPIKSTGIYYVVGSSLKPGDSTKKLLTISDTFGETSELDIFSTGSGVLTITAESAIPPNALDIYIEFSSIINKFFISKDREHVFDINATQRAWLFNPRSAPASSYTRNGWLTTINKDFDTATAEFYCRRNLFNTEETELGYFTDSNGDAQPAWYKYSIDLVENIKTTDYENSNAGYDVRIEYVDNEVFNKIKIIGADLTSKYSDDINSVTNKSKVQIDGSNTREVSISSVELVGSDTIIEFGKTSILPSDVSVVNDTIDVGTSIADGIQITFVGSDLPAPLSEGVVYYVVNSENTTIQISESENGSAIALTDVGTGTHAIKYNVTTPDIANCNCVRGSSVVEINGVFDYTQIEAGDYIVAVNSTFGEVFPVGTVIKSINASSGKLILNKSATTTITMDIAIIDSITGKIYYPDKTVLRIPQLRIETDPNKMLNSELDDDQKYALYADQSISSDIPSTVFMLPASPVILVSGVESTNDGKFADFDIVDAASEELIESFFEFEHVDNIDTTNYPALEYDYRRDDNTHILAKDAFGEYIHKNVNISKDFSGVADQKYSLIEKIERLAYQKDPNVIDIDLIEYLARYMGYDITVLKDDLDSSPIHGTSEEREMALRKTIQNLPEYHAIKSTEAGLQALLLTFGVVGRVVKLWSVKSDPYLGRWFSDDEVPSFIKLNAGGNRVLDPTIKREDGGPTELVPTPHFKLTVNAEPDDPDLAPTNVDLKRVKLAIVRNKPINTVFDGIVSQLQFVHDQQISRPSFRNKVKMSFSVGFDTTEFDGVIDDFNECNCP